MNKINLKHGPFMLLTVHCCRSCYTSGTCLAGEYVGIDLLVEGSAI